MALVERKIDKLGRIVLPMYFRKALGLEGEAAVILGISGNTITVRGVDSACRLCGSARNVSEKFGVCRECINKIKEDKILKKD